MYQFTQAQLNTIEKFSSLYEEKKKLEKRLADVESRFSKCERKLPKAENFLTKPNWKDYLEINAKYRTWFSYCESTKYFMNTFNVRVYKGETNKERHTLYQDAIDRLDKEITVLEARSEDIFQDLEDMENTIITEELKKREEEIVWLP